MALQQADPPGRPVRRERVADDPAARDRAPEAAVVAAAAGARPRVRLAHRPAVAVERPVHELDPVARAGHHALDERRGALLRGLLDADLAVGRLRAALLAGRALRTCRRVEDQDGADRRVAEV